jgi:hypothetical protein
LTASEVLRLHFSGRPTFQLPRCWIRAGGERAAAISSLLDSAKLNDIDPELYLRHVLERIG